MLLTQNVSGFGFMVGGNACDILSVSLGTLTNGVLSDLRNHWCINPKDHGGCNHPLYVRKVAMWVSELCAKF